MWKRVIGSYAAISSVGTAVYFNKVANILSNDREREEVMLYFKTHGKDVEYDVVKECYDEYTNIVNKVGSKKKAHGVITVTGGILGPIYAPYIVYSHLR